MAIYHMSVSNVSRAGGASSCASLAYISGEEVTDERTGKTYDYSRKERVLATETILPNSAPPEYADPKKLFNAVEKFETAGNARTAKKIEVALPRELLTLDRQRALVEDFIRENLTSRGYCATYAIHDQNVDDDGNGNSNVHAHILIPNRPVDERGQWVTNMAKTVYANDRDENGTPIYNPEKPSYDPARRDETAQYKIPLLDENGKQRVRIRKNKGVEKLWARVKTEQNPMDSIDFLKTLRKNWAVSVNRCPEVLVPVDHRSHADRGLETAPTKHEGQFARTLERRGVIDRVCQYNRDVRAANNELEAAQFEINVLELDLADIRDRIQTAKNAGHGIGGKIGNMASSAAGAVKSAGKTAKSTLDNLTGGRPDERSRGFIGAVADTVNDGVSSAINKSPIGVVSAPFKMPLNVMKNVDCTEVEQMKAAEADKKSKKRKKGNANDNDKKSPGISRSRGR